MKLYEADKDSWIDIEKIFLIEPIHSYQHDNSFCIRFSENFYFVVRDKDLKLLIEKRNKLISLCLDQSGSNKTFDRCYSCGPKVEER